MTAARDTRRTLLDAASVEFALSGRDVARRQAIVKRAGINERMVNHHFGSKQGLHEAALADQRASLGDGHQPGRQPAEFHPHPRSIGEMPVGDRLRLCRRNRHDDLRPCEASGPGMG
ncbi:MAG: TetR/AcrR family transcriptional regulator [Burkholderiales bacterium]|nr:MAG: TetR/AcrR family transcriptional regulator [Burkholderiales bacterium]